MVIYWELCEQFKFDHTNQQYIHEPDSVLESEIQKLMSDEIIKTDLIIIYKINFKKIDK